MKYEVVYLVDDTYAVRRRKWWSFPSSYEYLDLVSNYSYWWVKTDRCFEDCKTNDVEKCKQIVNKLLVGDIVVHP